MSYREQYAYPTHAVGWKIEAASGHSFASVNPLNKPVLRGTLRVHILRARGLFNKALIGAMSPLVEVKLGQRKKTSGAVSKGGTDPVWSTRDAPLGETLEFRVDNDGSGDDVLGALSTLRVRVFDKGRLGKAEIGTCRVPLSAVVQLHGLHEHLDKRQLPKKRHTKMFAAQAWSTATTTRRLAAVDEGERGAAGEQGNEDVERLISPHLLAASSPSRSASMPELSGGVVRAGDSTLMSAEECSAARIQQMIALSPDLRNDDKLALVQILRRAQAQSRQVEEQRAAWFDLGRDSLQRTPAGQIMLAFDFVPDDGADLFRQVGGAMKRAPEVSKVFGAPLARGVQLNDGDIPNPLVDVVSFLNSDPEHLKTPGLFRVPASSEDLLALRIAYDHEQEVEFDDPHVAASLFKMYLRELPSPLIPYEHYEAFMDVEEPPTESVLAIKNRAASEASGAISLAAASSAQGKAAEGDDEDEVSKTRRLVSQYRDLVDALPRLNRDVLAYVVEFLHEIAAIEENRMDAHNLAVCFAPTVLRKRGGRRRGSMFEKMRFGIGCIKTLILYHDDIFVDSTDGDSNVTEGPTSTTSSEEGRRARAKSKSKAKAKRRSSKHKDKKPDWDEVLRRSRKRRASRNSEASESMKEALEAVDDEETAAKLAELRQHYGSLHSRQDSLVLRWLAAKAEEELESDTEETTTATGEGREGTHHRTGSAASSGSTTSHSSRSSAGGARPQRRKSRRAVRNHRRAGSNSSSSSAGRKSRRIRSKSVVNKGVLGKKKRRAPPKKRTKSASRRKSRAAGRSKPRGRTYSSFTLPTWSSSSSVGKKPTSTTSEGDRKPKRYPKPRRTMPSRVMAMLNGASPAEADRDVSRAHREARRKSTKRRT